METTWITLLNEIMQTVVVPLMGILTVFLIKVIREKMDAAAKDTKNETLAKYILMLKETVVDCVEATNQTFVDAIKASGEFTPEAQKAAFEKTLNAVTGYPLRGCKRVSDGSLWRPGGIYYCSHRGYC
mgnify:CR=1 FL=1